MYTARRWPTEEPIKDVMSIKWHI